VNFMNHIDPRLREAMEAELRALDGKPAEPLPRPVTVVLAGHRAAGKSRLLPEVAQALGRPAVDLDQLIARELGGEAAMRELVERAQGEFRQLERRCFERLPRGVVVAVGGGFLAHHRDALRGCITALVPVSETTFRERLSADASRPRLHPELSLDDELSRVWREREPLHASFSALSLPVLSHRAAAGARPVRVVTLPRDTDAVRFARRAKAAGAEWLEVRTDLYSGAVDALAAELPLLIAERGTPIPSAWRAHAHLTDVEAGIVDAPEHGWIRSFHSPGPLARGDALAHWAGRPAGALVKHAEPLGRLRDATRLFELQRRLEHATVLATGDDALPVRARLSVRNELEYCALDGASASAKGQRLLADVVREHRAGPLRSEGRLAIIGHDIAHARSPRIHRQPFDRIDLPADHDAAAWVNELEGYRGLAITSPFKRRVVPGLAVNTLVRRGSSWETANTDIAGAEAALKKLAAREVTVLGEGGVADALRAAAARLGISLRFEKRVPLPLGGRVHASGLGSYLWTWPPHLEVTPPNLHGARVGVITYGRPAQTIAMCIRKHGGIPVFLGSRWFIAQARAQRALWESP
jgi:shikimate kinase